MCDQNKTHVSVVHMHDFYIHADGAHFFYVRRYVKNKEHKEVVFKGGWIDSAMYIGMQGNNQLLHVCDVGLE